MNRIGDIRLLNIFGEAARFDHIGMPVRSIQEISPSSKVVTDLTQRVSVAFISLNGLVLELMEPYGDNSPIARSLGEGVKWHHVCYAVKDLERVMQTCRKLGFHRIRRPTQAPAFENRQIAWVYSNEYGLFELLEQDRPIPDDDVPGGELAS